MKKQKFKILFSCAVLLFAACGEYDKEKGWYYHKAMGEGYVFYKETNEPAPFASVHVSACFPSTGYFSVGCKDEYYKADENGYYKVKFIKKVSWIGKSNTSTRFTVDAGTVNYASEPVNYGSEAPIHLDKDFLKKQKKTFKLDTLWLRKSRL
jgi:hypothetical protein